MPRGVAMRFSQRRPTWLWLVPFILAFAWLGARSLNTDSIWHDERRTIQDAKSFHYNQVNTLVEVWERVARRNPWHAPGYFILLNFWGRVVGWEPPALRAFSLLAGILAIAWTYRLGYSMISAQAGVIAGAVMGSSAFLVNYLHELRMYTLLACLSAFIIWIYWHIIHNKHEPTRKAWMGLCLGGVAILYIHYFGAIVLGAIGLYHLLLAKQTRRWWWAVLIMGLSALLFVPWIQVMLTGVERAQVDEYTIERAHFSNTGEILSRFALLVGNGGVILLILATGLSFLTLRQRNHGAHALWFFCIAILGLLLLTNVFVPVMPLTRMRYTLIVWPTVSILIAVGMLRLPQWGILVVLGLWIFTGISAALIPNNGFLQGFRISGTEYHYPWHTAMQPFSQLTQPQDALLLFQPPEMPHSAHSDQKISEYYLQSLDLSIKAVEAFSTYSEQLTEYNAALPIAYQSNRVWIGYDQRMRQPLLPVFEAALRSNYKQCPNGLAQATFQVDLYVRSEVCCRPTSPPIARFANSAALTGIELVKEPDSTALFTGWSMQNNNAQNNYHIILEIENLNGNSMATVHYGLPNSDFSCQRIPIHAGLVPDIYAVYGMVYEGQSGEPVSGEIVATQAESKRLLFTTFRL